MRKLIVAAVIVGAVVFAKQKFAPANNADAGGAPSFMQSVLSKLPRNKTPDDVAKERFEKFMKSWKDGGVSENDAAQQAACLWARGKIFIRESEDFKAAVFGFDRWRKAKDLYVQDLDYEIGAYRREGNQTIADVKINGYRHSIAIPHGGDPMTWAD